MSSRGCSFNNKTRRRPRAGKGSEHHYHPTSRGGEDTEENTGYLDPDAHEAYHCVFGNLLIEEIIFLIEHLWADKYTGEIQEKYLLGDKRKKRQKAWKVLFRNITNAKDVISIIKSQFTKREP